jgi:hypothetical protein
MTTAKAKPFPWSGQPIPDHIKKSQSRVKGSTKLTGRACGECALCCKLYIVKEIPEKPKQSWCQKDV